MRTALPGRQIVGQLQGLQDDQATQAVADEMQLRRCFCARANSIRLFT